MALSLKHLRLVQEIIRQGSVTGAAKTLYLTQSALSHQLAELERLAGGPAFLRAGKRMVPTSIGLRILGAADEVLDGLSELESDLLRIVSGQSVSVRFTTQCYTTYQWLPEIIRMVRDQHPHIEFEIVAEASADPSHALLAGGVDLALCYDGAPSAYIERRPLFDDDMVLIVGREHHLAAKSFVTADDFRELHLLVYLNRPAESLLYQRVLNPAGVRPKRVSEVRLTEGILALVEGGVGAAVVSRWSALPALQSKRVVSLQITETGLRREWHAAFMADSEKRATLEALTQVLQRNPLTDFASAHARSSSISAVKDSA